MKHVAPPFNELFVLSEWLKLGQHSHSFEKAASTEQLRNPAGHAGAKGAQPPSPQLNISTTTY